MILNSNKKDATAVQKLGRMVNDFIIENEMKSVYVRTASHFGSTQFVAFKKAS